MPGLRWAKSQGSISLLKDVGCSRGYAGGPCGPTARSSGLGSGHLGGRYIGRVLAAALKETMTHLLRAVISIFESQGFRVIGSSDVTRTSAGAEPGPVGRLAPNNDDRADIRAWISGSPAHWRARYRAIRRGVPRSGSRRRSRGRAKTRCFQPRRSAPARPCWPKTA